MQKKDMLYEGKAKKVWTTDDDGLLIVEYKDDATAFNGLKKGSIAGKGGVNNRVSNHLMQVLDDQDVPTHFVRELSERETLVKRVNIVPIEVIVRNIVAGSLAERVGREEGSRLACPVLEYSYKDDALGDPMINRWHALALELATPRELDEIDSLAFKINGVLSEYLKRAGLELVDFKLEFGRLESGEIVLADEISPDTCRFWDIQTHEKLDKDRFRRDLGGVEDAYNEILKRLLGE